MMFESDAYSVECPAGGDAAVLRGVMRLASPQAYDEALAAVRARVDAGGALTVDVSAVPFMNSSGIRALAGLVLRARDRGTRLRLVGSAQVPWQKKTAASLRSIDPGLAVELR